MLTLVKTICCTKIGMFSAIHLKQYSVLQFAKELQTLRTIHLQLMGMFKQELLAYSMSSLRDALCYFHIDIFKVIGMFAVV